MLLYFNRRYFKASCRWPIPPFSSFPYIFFLSCKISCSYLPCSIILPWFSAYSCLSSVSTIWIIVPAWLASSRGLLTHCHCAAPGCHLSAASIHLLFWLHSSSGPCGWELTSCLWIAVSTTTSCPFSISPNFVLYVFHEPLPPLASSTTDFSATATCLGLLLTMTTS